ncbi:MAG: hypothetical protein FJ387_10150 [Verrucomicrobia bacterium]|nr:hypothetical protein [Verrucomicrobiota bacterium]
MSRAVLVIICDFLLISLLSLARFDDLPPAETPAPQTDGGVDQRTVQDMVDVMKQALEQERANRDQLQQALEQAKLSLAEREKLLAQRAGEITKFEENLQNATATAQQLAEERARLQKTQEQTLNQLAALREAQARAEESARKLQTELAQSATEASISEAKAAALQSELTARRDEARQMQDQISSLQRISLEAEQEKGRLATQLTAVQTTATIVREQLQETRVQVESLTQEKAQIQQHATVLARGMDDIAKSSTELTTEIRENRPLAPNTIYTQYLTNRVTARLSARRSGVLGFDVSRERESHTVLFQDGAQIYALFHVEDTPMPVWNQAYDWEQFTGALSEGRRQLAVKEIALVTLDPRVLVAPIDSSGVARLGVTPYPLAREPGKYQQAVLVGAKEGYYGEAEFKLSAQHPNYVRMERRAFRRLFGKFSPSRGDLVFALTGELLGIMANNEFCVVLSGIKPTQTLKLGDDLGIQKTSRLSVEMANRLQILPFEMR